jgi:predicted nuclease of predicted toxin-antitoxin system
VILWIDAQLSPALVRWVSDTFGVAAHAVRDLGLREAKDLGIFHAAREAGAVVMSKDSDFVLLLERFGPPP